MRLSQGRKRRRGTVTDLERIARRTAPATGGREPLVVEGPWTGGR